MMNRVNRNIQREWILWVGIGVFFLCYLFFPKFSGMFIDLSIFLVFSLYLLRNNLLDAIIFKAISAFMLLMFSSILFSLQPYESTKIVSSFAFDFLALYVILVSITKEKINLFLMIIALTALWIDGYAIWQYITGNVVSFEGFTGSIDRVIGGTAHPIIFSGYLLNFICLTLVLGISKLGKNRKQAVLLLSAAITSAGVLILTGTRGGWIAFIGVVLFWIAIDYRYSWKRCLALSVILVLFISGIFYDPGRQQRVEILTSTPQHADAGRMDMWKAAGKIFLDYPVFGAGLYQYAKLYTQKYRNEEVKYEFWQNAHNDYLNFLAETGLVGFLAYIYLLGTLFFVHLKRYLGNRQNIWSLAISMMVICLALEGMSYSYFSIPTNMRLFFICIGLCLVAERSEKAPN